MNEHLLITVRCTDWLQKLIPRVHCAQRINLSIGY